MAEVITDTLVRRLGRRRTCRTRDYRLDGAPPGRWEEFEKSEPNRLAQMYSIGQESARHLVHRYGRHAADVARYITHDPSLAERVAGAEPDLCAELAYQRDHEMSILPTDSLLRRTRLGLFQPGLLSEKRDLLSRSQAELEGVSGLG